MTTQIVENSKVQSSAPFQDGTVYRVLVAVSFCHLMNDTMQSSHADVSAMTQSLQSIVRMSRVAIHL